MKDRMLAGDLYIADDDDLAVGFARAQELLARYNATAHADQDERDRILMQTARRGRRRRRRPAAVSL
jgi:maltose O-acetyltransferase